MAREDWGPSVLNGEVLRTSPSALQKADPDSPWGCPRKYWYAYVMGIREPMGEAAAKGVKIHKEIEKYLKSGKKALSAIAMSALKFYPTPEDPNLELEHECSPLECFEVSGIPVLMYLDCISPYSTYFDTMGVSQDDPPGTIEIIDWKSKGNIDYALTNQQLLDTIQMGMYGAYGLRRYNAPHVRLSHVYLQTKGRKRASKSTILASPKDIEAKWGRIESVGRSIKDYAKEPDINKIPVNLKECGKCFYANRCPKNSNHTLEMVFGKALDMPLLPTEPTDTAGHLAALQAEDAATRETVPEGFAAALAFIQVQGYGRPTLSGRAYRAACSGAGTAPDAAGTSAGDGKAALINLEDPQDVIGIAGEVATKVGVAFVIPAPVLPADAPKSNPTIAAEPVAGFGGAVVIEEHGATEVFPASIPEVQNPVDTPAHIETVSPQAPTGESAEMSKCLKAAQDDKWGPVKKPEIAKAFTELLAQKAPGIVTEPLTAPGGAPVVIKVGVQIYIDCVAEGTDLAPWIKQFTDLLCKEYGCKDVRLADPKSKLGYGGWRGALAVCVAESYATLEPGAYYLDTRGNEILEAAAAGFTAEQVTARGIR